MDRKPSTAVLSVCLSVSQRCRRCSSTAPSSATSAAASTSAVTAAAERPKRDVPIGRQAERAERASERFEELQRRAYSVKMNNKLSEPSSEKLYRIELTDCSSSLAACSHLSRLRSVRGDRSIERCGRRPGSRCFSRALIQGDAL